MQIRKAHVATVLLLLLVVSFQNCGPGFKVTNELISGDFSSNANTNVDTTGESTPNYVLNCYQSTNQACLPWKNPVASQKMSLTPKYTTAVDISNWQLHGAQITGYDTSGFLKNTTIEILPGGRQINASGQLVTVPLLERVSTTTGDFKFPNNNDPNHKLRQVSAYYWLQFQNDYMRSRTGVFYAQGKDIKVYTHNPDYNNAAFDGLDQIIILGGNQGDAYAMHGEVIVHEMGHANIHFATGGDIWQMQGSQNADVACIPNSTSTVTCCPTKNGCVKAINEGQADFHSALMFSSKPQFGETWANNTNGLKTPADDLFRDPTKNASLTANEAYELSIVLSGQNVVLNGESRSMAALYTSIWWELRRAATRATGGETKEMDELFSEHLAALNGNDNFLTARDKILALDQSLYQSKYRAIINNEFSRRGY